MDNPACHQRYSGNLLVVGSTLLQNLCVLKIINQVKSDETGSQSPVNVDLDIKFCGIGKVKESPSFSKTLPCQKWCRDGVEALKKARHHRDHNRPTPWVSPIVIVPKSSGQVRMCADMWEANKAVKREKPLMPTIDDLVAELNGATVFSKLDLLSGYHQLELEPESRNITTFSTHIGLRRYKRLMFGINAASENDVMSYFNPRLKTEVIVDASPVGLGGLLVQDSKSRALSDVESISICSNRKGNAGSGLGSRKFSSLLEWIRVYHYHRQQGSPGNLSTVTRQLQRASTDGSWGSCPTTVNLSIDLAKTPRIQPILWAAIQVT